ISELGVPPYRLLAVTFTNKAAREMAARVQALVEGSLEGIWLGTFHAMCARILRRESALLPFKSNFVIMDEDDQQTLIKRTLRELNIDDKLNRPTSVLGAISTAKNNLQGADDFPARNYREEVVARAYKRYQELLVANNAVDFDDLLLETVKLLRDNPQVRENYANRFECVLVDEFQDTNLAQYELLKLLSGHHHNLFVVGDEDQSIYRWRGADYRNVLRFEEDYRNCQKILLEQNYRSTQTVLDAARAVIDRNAHRTPKHLFSDRGKGERIILYEAVDDHAEAAYVVDTIQQLLSSHKAKGSEFAIMYRTNAQSRLLEEAFLRAGMPYRLVGAQRFYGRREVKDVIAYLRLASNPADEISLGRVINVPPRGIGDKTVLGLQLAARAAHLTPGEVLLDLGLKGEDSPFWPSFKGRGANLLGDVGGLLMDWQKLRDGPLPALFDAVIDSTGYESYINDGSDEGESRWENVMELRRLAFEYAERGLVAFLENLALVSDQDTLPEKADAPTLLTLHAAKGLEFSQVFITGMDEGLLPHSRSRDDPEEMAEERRLFYVGLTRAKNQLYLVRADQRSTFGSFEYSVPSRFLDDIPAEMILCQGTHAHATRTRRTDTFSAWALPPGPGSSAAAKSAPILEPRFKAGMHVKHAAWGEGLVVDVRLQDGDERIDVFFEAAGFKRLLGSIANLEIIK
ncbi:MAG TPA: UvrD-helicase domain-containing protein, partial [Longilinea sp.]|nr:UvrD-helicase domain-containing protein [Longilinea sp.]